MEHETRSTNRSGQKLRGRPRKPLDENPLTIRVRAQARKSQKLFRSRQKAVVEALERRANSLENVIEAMSNEFMALGEYVTRNTCITNQSATLGELKGRTQKFLDIARSVEPTLLDDDTLHSFIPVEQSSLHPLSNTNSASFNQALLEPYDDIQVSPAVLHGNAGNNSLDLAVANLDTAFQDIDPDQNQISQQPFDIAAGRFTHFSPVVCLRTRLPDLP